MTNIEFTYPVLLIREGDYNLYCLTKNLGLISKGGDTFYKRPIKLIDSLGFILSLITAKNIGRANLINSLKYFQPMHQMHLEFEKEDQISLDNLKKKILNHINLKPKHWLALGTIEMIENWVSEKNSFEDLMRMFK